MYPSKRSRRRSLTRAGTAIAIAVSGATALTGAALAQSSPGLGRATEFQARFTTDRAGAASGLRLQTRGMLPAARVTEAPAVRQTVVLPAGTTLRLRRLPQCEAGDAAIALSGAEAVCPARTRVGTGGADGVFHGAPVHFDLGIYAVRGHLVFAAEQGGKPLKQSFLGLASGRRLVLTVPTLDGQIAPTGFEARVAARRGAGAWLRTPVRCPASHRWHATGHFQGVSSATPPTHPVTPRQTLTDRQRCRA
jgi:hypothetical protein